MDGNLLAAVGIIALLALIFLGVNIGLSMFLIGFIGFAYVTNLGAALSQLGTYSMGCSMTYTMTVIPLFVLMGNFAFYSGISDGLFNASKTLFGRTRGGLAYAAIVACALFGSICGSLAATTATMSKVAQPIMAKNNYKEEVIGGTLACAGTLGTMIPPSTPLIIYGIITSTSIGKLFAASILPGILQAVCFCVCVFIIGKKDNSLFPAGQATTAKEKIVSLKGFLGMAILFVIVLGGMFSGVVSVTEAAAVGAVVALVFMVIFRKANLKNFKESFYDTIKTVGFVMITLVGANVFGSFITITKMPMNLANWITNSNVQPIVVIIIIMIVYAIMGCLMDTLALMILTTPIFLPIVIAFGYDIVWFGIIVLMIMNMGAVTPPVGLSCYVASNVTKIPLASVFKGAIPFLGAFVVALVIVIAFPQIALLIPSHVAV